MEDFLQLIDDCETILIQDGSLSVNDFNHFYRLITSDAFILYERSHLFLTFVKSSWDRFSLDQHSKMMKWIDDTFYRFTSPLSTLVLAEILGDFEVNDEGLVVIQSKLEEIHDLNHGYAIHSLLRMTLQNSEPSLMNKHIKCWSSLLQEKNLNDESMNELNNALKVLNAKGYCIS